MENIKVSDLANTLQALQNCRKSNNVEWTEKHEEKIAEYASLLPHGSGFDSGCEILENECTKDKIVFSADFHHMDDNGYYDGWTSHKVIVTASLIFGYKLRITGKNKRDIKDYISQTFHEILN